jgi:CheY-like chemotaxis protein
VSPAEVVRDAEKIIRETFPKDIVIRVSVAPALWSVHADTTQLHQVVMNLCVNARDALALGGDLDISVENVTLDETYAGMHPGSHPGDFVRIRVADSGVGIPQEIQERIFEPFFTTKEVGKGTGLGLSTSLAIVRRHGGFVHVHSAPGRGTRMDVYLPATSAHASAADALQDASVPRGSGELLLVVDDEEAIRRIMRRTLERFGYRVVVAGHGGEALNVYRRQRDEIAAVITDMAMPVMDGPALILALKAMDPDVRIIGSSGYAFNDSVAKAMGAGVRHFVSKPYTADAMLRTLRELLDEGTAGA